jgi:hypothetical protein
MFELLELPMELFTTNREESRFHLVNKEDMHRLREENDVGRRAIGFILTGWSKKKTQVNPFLYRIPYSCHSSYPELKMFLKSIKFEKLVYTVDTSPNFDSADEMKFYSKYSRPEKPQMM